MGASSISAKAVNVPSTRRVATAACSRPSKLGCRFPFSKPLGGEAVRYVHLGEYRVIGSARRTMQFPGNSYDTEAFVFTLDPIAKRGMRELQVQQTHPETVVALARGGYEHPLLRSIAEGPPKPSGDTPTQTDPEARRQAPERRTTAHHNLVKALERRAKSAGLSCVRDQYADVLCGGDIFEMKTLENDEGNCSDPRGSRSTLSLRFHS